nr:MAG TPA: hypothetical protein [Caudoviricetes sp.]
MASNINGLNVGLSDIQKTYIGSAYVNTMPDTSHTTLTVTQDIPTMYINGDTPLWLYSIITNNNRSVDTVQFYYYNRRYVYDCGRSDFKITYNLQTGKYSYTLSSCRGLSLGSITVQNTGDAILVSVNVSPGQAGLDDDGDWTYYDLYWDSACTDRSVKTLQFKLTGSLVWYQDDKNHGAGYKMIIPISNVRF